MSDSDRLVDSSESEVERMLLRSGCETAPREARRRALLVATAAVTASTLSAGNAAGIVATRASLGAKAASVALAKWVVIVGLAGAGAIAGSVAIRAVREEPSARSTPQTIGAVAGPAGRGPPNVAPSALQGAPPATPSSLLGSTSTGAFALATSADSRAPLAVPSSGPHPTGVNAPATPSAGASANAELSMLDQARSQIADGDPARALSTLDAYLRRFPNGGLSPEASVLRIEALVAAGDRPAATRAAQSLLQANPTSPYARRIRSLLEAPNP